MIGRLSGILFDKNPAQLLVDCNGVGYEVSVPMSTFYNLPSTGEKVTLLMSSHDPLVDGYVDEIVQLKDGQILQPNGNNSEVK